MVERQVTRRMGGMVGTIARAHVAVLADVAGDHPLGQAGPSRVRMDVMVGTDARQPRVLAAPSRRSARDDTADRQDAVLRQIQALERWASITDSAMRRQIERLRERRQALITAAVTGQLEIPGVAA
jgi:hypothetical protein